MKKLFLLVALVCTLGTAQAQFKIGPHLAFPTGDASDFYNLVWGGDIYYMFGKPDSFINLGAASGFLNFVGDEIDIAGTPTEIDNAQFLPIAAAARIVFFSTLSAGADVGFGVGLNGGNDGGFYWRLNAGLDLGNVIEVNAFYYAISVDATDSGSFNYGAFGLNLLLEIGGKKD